MRTDANPHVKGGSWRPVSQLQNLAPPLRRVPMSLCEMMRCFGLWMYRKGGRDGVKRDCVAEEPAGQSVELGRPGRKASSGAIHYFSHFSVACSAPRNGARSGRSSGCGSATDSRGTGERSASSRAAAALARRRSSYPANDWQALTTLPERFDPSTKLISTWASKCPFAHSAFRNECFFPL